MKPYIRDKKVFGANEIPEGCTYEAGYLVSTNGEWRNKRPVINNDKCVGCMQCYFYCPDGVISEKEGKMDIDYNFCKGCGICVKICKLDAISLEEEK